MNTVISGIKFSHVRTVVFFYNSIAFVYDKRSIEAEKSSKILGTHFPSIAFCWKYYFWQITTDKEMTGHLFRYMFTITKSPEISPTTVWLNLIVMVQNTFAWKNTYIEVSYKSYPFPLTTQNLLVLKCKAISGWRPCISTITRLPNSESC